MFKWGSKGGPPAGGSATGSTTNQNDKREWHQQIPGEKYFGMENVSRDRRPDWAGELDWVRLIGLASVRCSQAGRIRRHERDHAVKPNSGGQITKLTPI